MMIFLLVITFLSFGLLAMAYKGPKNLFKGKSEKEIKSHQKSLLVLSVLLVMLTGLYGLVKIISSNDKPIQETLSEQVTNNADDEIKTVVTDAENGDIEVIIQPSIRLGVSLRDIEVVGNAQRTINVNFNVVDTFTKQDIDMVMTELFEALYTSDEAIDAVNLNAFVNDELIYSTYLSNDEANAFNWSVEDIEIQEASLSQIWMEAYVSDSLDL